MKKTKFSIIIPIYKVPINLLKRCINSAINQTYNDIDIVLIDDGSPDECGRICDEFKSNDKRICVIHKANGGLSSARNAGVRMSRGEYIMFVDGDDWLQNNTCEKMISIIDKYEPDVIMFAMTKDYLFHSEPYHYYLKDDYMYVDEECKWLRNQILNYNSNIATVATKIIKKDLLESNNIFHREELKQGAEGIVFNFDLFKYVKKVYFTNKIFYHYTYNNSSITAMFNERDAYLVLKCFEYIKKSIENDNEKELLETYRNRVVYAVTAAVISGFFNPENNCEFKDKCIKCTKYLNNDIAKDSLENATLKGFTIQRRIVVFLIKNRFYHLLNVLGIIRRKYKNLS